LLQRTSHLTYRPVQPDNRDQDSDVGRPHSADRTQQAATDAGNGKEPNP
jgi:hypothetical protein